VARQTRRVANLGLTPDELARQGGRGRDTSAADEKRSMVQLMEALSHVPLPDEIRPWNAQKLNVFP
jgi:hypothetical protein